MLKIKLPPSTVLVKAMELSSSLVLFGSTSPSCWNLAWYFRGIVFHHLLRLWINEFQLLANSWSLFVRHELHITVHILPSHLRVQSFLFPLLQNCLMFLIAINSRVMTCGHKFNEAFTLKQFHCTLCLAELHCIPPQLFDLLLHSFELLQFDRNICLSIHLILLILSYLSFWTSSLWGHLHKSRRISLVD